MSEQTHTTEGSYLFEPTINWTAPMLARFKKAYSNAAKAGAETFTFDGNEFVLGYAYYLIQYLEGKFNR